MVTVGAVVCDSRLRSDGDLGKEGMISNAQREWQDCLHHEAKLMVGEGGGGDRIGSRQCLGDENTLTFGS